MCSTKQWARITTSSISLPWYYYSAHMKNFLLRNLTYNFHTTERKMIGQQLTGFIFFPFLKLKTIIALFRQAAKPITNLLIIAQRTESRGVDCCYKISLTWKVHISTLHFRRFAWTIFPHYRKRKEGGGKRISEKSYEISK